MKTKRIIIFIGLSIALIAFSGNLAYAANSLGINVLTGGNQPNDQRTQFNLDEYVYIGWTASAGNEPKTGTPIPATVDVSVYDPDGDPVNLYKVATERATPSSITLPETVLVNQGEGDKWCICFKADLAGSYEIDCAGATVKGHQRIGVGYINVLPESTLGSIMALSAGIAAFGTIGALKRRNLKAKKR